MQSADPCSDVHARGTSFFGTASCMSCFGYFVSWPVLFRFGAAETSFCGIFLNDRWVDQLPLIHLLVLTLSFRKSVLILGRNAINNGKVGRISFLNFAFLLPSCEASFYGILDDRWSLMTGFLRFICLCSPFHLRKRVLILFGFRSIFISLPLSTVCEEREFTFLTVRLMLDVLSKYSYSLYIGTLQVRHWSVAYYRWQFPIWRERFKYQLTEFAK